MRVPGLKTIRKRSRQWRSRRVSGGVILGYHRVADPVDDPYGLCVSPSHFAAQMEYLRQHMQPLALPQLVEQALAGALPPRAVAVTFDDGYADSLHAALPILARYQIPATLFVTSGYLGGEFWWDELVRLVQCRPPAWWQTAVPHLKNHDMPAFYQWLLPLPAADRQAKMEQLWNRIGGKKEGPSLVLTEPELRQLATSGWWEVGAHTVTHPALDTLAPEEQMSEIGTSRKALEMLVGKPVRLFSYPNGRHTPDTIRFVQHAGYELACDSHADIVWTKSDRFCLPRIWAKNAPVVRFSDGWIAVR